MTDALPPSRRPRRSKLLWGPITTIILEAAVVATLAMVGVGISSLMLWLVG
jgi:hypothetical protein